MVYRCFGKKDKDTHKNYPKHVIKHLDVTPSVMNNNSTLRLRKLCELGLDGPSIKKMMTNESDMTITQSTIAVARKNYLSVLCEALKIDPSETASERLISYFESQTNISFLYVLHDTNSSFVTRRKAKEISCKIQCLKR